MNETARPFHLQGSAAVSGDGGRVAPLFFRLRDQSGARLSASRASRSGPTVSARSPARRRGSTPSRSAMSRRSTGSPPSASSRSSSPWASSCRSSACGACAGWCSGSASRRSSSRRWRSTAAAFALGLLRPPRLMVGAALACRRRRSSSRCSSRASGSARRSAARPSPCCLFQDLAVAPLLVMAGAFSRRRAGSGLGLGPHGDAGPRRAGARRR